MVKLHQQLPFSFYLFSFSFFQEISRWGFFGQHIIYNRKEGKINVHDRGQVMVGTTTHWMDESDRCDGEWVRQKWGFKIRKCTWA